MKTDDLSLPMGPETGYSIPALQTRDALLSSRLVAGARTLAVGSGLIAAGVGLIGGGGLGSSILEAARLLQYGVMWKGLLAVLALALVLDLMLGLVQMISLQYSEYSGEPATADGVAA